MPRLAQVFAATSTLDWRVVADSLNAAAAYDSGAGPKQQKWEAGCAFPTGHPFLDRGYDASLAAQNQSGQRGGNVSKTPRLPIRFVDRPELRDQAVSALTDQDATEPVMVLLVGMGGAGKSTLAKAVTADPRIQAQFPDGVFWIDTGTEPNILACQNHIATALGADSPIVDVRLGRSVLSGLFAGSRCLVVLDDVWDPDLVRMLSPDSPSSALLATCQDRRVYLDDCVVINVDLLRYPDDRTFLANQLGIAADDLPNDSAAVLESCEGLPLALAIIGGRIRAGTSWNEIAYQLTHADLRRMRITMRDYGKPNLLAALEVGVKMLDVHERQRLFELAAFFGRGEVPLQVVFALWDRAGLLRSHCVELIEDFADLSLVQHDAGRRTLRLHNLLYRYLSAAQSPNNIRATHSMLVDLYFSRWGTLDLEFPKLLGGSRDDDFESYGLRHLCWHLVEADRVDDLHSLLAAELHSGDVSQNLWFLARERQGGTAGYLEDIRLAWRQAVASTDAALEGEPSASVALEFRYMLVAASLASVADRIPGSLLVALAVSGVWTADQALAYAASIPTPERRANAIALLAPHLPAELVSAAFDIAIFGGDTAERIEALGCLLPRLADDELAKAFKVARAVSEPEDRAWTLLEFAAHLPPDQQHDLCREALVEAGRIDDAEIYCWIIVQAACQFNRDAKLRAKALSAIERVDRPGGHVEMLAELAVHVPAEAGAERDRLLQTVLDRISAGKVTFPTDIIVQITPHLAIEQQRQALSIVLAFREEFRRAEALAKLAPHLAPTLLGEAVDAANEIEDADYRTQALAGIQPHFGHGDKSDVMAACLRSIAGIGNPVIRARALCCAAPWLPDQLTTLAVSYIANFDRQELREEVAEALAPFLSADLLADVLDRICPIGDTAAQIEARVGLTPYYPSSCRETELADTLTAVEKLADSNLRGGLLHDLVPHLPDRLRERIFAPPPDGKIDLNRLISRADYLPASLMSLAIATARSSGADPDQKLDALTALLPQIPPGDRESVYLEVLGAIDQISWWDRKARAIVDLAPTLPASLLNNALDAAHRLPHESLVIKAIAGLVPALQGDAREGALAQSFSAVRDLDDPYFQLPVLITLIPFLPVDIRPDILDRALAAARQLGDGWRASRALITLAKYFPLEATEGLLKEAIQKTGNVKAVYQSEALSIIAEIAPKNLLGIIVKAVPDLPREDVKGAAIENVAPLLQEEARGQALAIALKIQDPGAKVEAITAIAAAQSVSDNSCWPGYWREAMKAAANAPRVHALKIVGRAAATATEVGGPETMQAIWEAVEDVCTWWK
jgi:hypothetical protein